jgi:signal transduction histidine kinase
MAADLAAVDEQRKHLVATVSHELRTPISALQALLENLADGVTDPDPQAIRTMLVQVERLGRLVTQLLDLSRLEAGSVPLDRRAFRVGEVLEQAAAEARLHAGDVSVDVRVEPKSLSVDGDPERIHQVVANLLENAVRYSPATGTVELSAQRRNGTVAIEVGDQGPGIAPDQVTQIFERFFRADPARSSADGGSGLGLAIARWVVELHGGHIEARQNHPRGCRMVVALPAAPAPRRDTR